MTVFALKGYSMRTFIICLLCFLPLSATAAQIANCDSKTGYEVTISNSGAKRVVTLPPGSGSVDAYGPEVSFQLEGQKPVLATGPADQFCIWHGHITVQKRVPGNGSDSGSGFR